MKLIYTDQGIDDLRSNIRRNAGLALALNIRTGYLIISTLAYDSWLSSLFDTIKEGLNDYFYGREEE